MAEVLLDEILYKVATRLSKEEDMENLMNTCETPATLDTPFKH